MRAVVAQLPDQAVCRLMLTTRMAGLPLNRCIAAPSSIPGAGKSLLINLSCDEIAICCVLVGALMVGEPLVAEQAVFWSKTDLCIFIVPYHHLIHHHSVLSYIFRSSNTLAPRFPSSDSSVYLHIIFSQHSGGGLTFQKFFLGRRPCFFSGQGLFVTRDVVEGELIRYSVYLLY